MALKAAWTRLGSGQRGDSPHSEPDPAGLSGQWHATRGASQGVRRPRAPQDRQDMVRRSGEPQGVELGPGREILLPGGGRASFRTWVPSVTTGHLT